MSLLRRFAPLYCLVAAAGVLVFAFNVHLKRVERAEHVTSIGGPLPPIDPASPTGYADGLRSLIVPGHNDESYQWIIQTQQMIGDGTWRVRHAAYDNAPVGRPVHSPSPLRWWLAFIAWLNHIFTGNPIGLAVERAALWAEPVLHLAIIAGAAAFVGRCFGLFAAALSCMVLAIGFPFAGMFIAGAPEDVGLTQAFILAGLLMLLQGAAHGEMPDASRRRWFAGAGALGGVAVWLNPSAAVPVMGGLALSGLLWAYCARKRPDGKVAAGTVLPWRAWGCGGAAVTLAAYLVEYAPGSLSWSEPGLVEVHPLYAAAWMGAAELVQRAGMWFGGEPFAKGRAGLWFGVAALVALVALPAVMAFTDARGFLTPEPSAARVTALLGVISARGVVEWLQRDGLTLAAFATLLPALLVLFPLGQTLQSVLRNSPPPAPVLLLGPALVALVFAWHRLNWWNTFDLVAIALVVALAMRRSGELKASLRSVGWLVAAMSLFLPGLWLVVGLHQTQATDEIAEADQQSLVERDFAHWLARRSGVDGAIVLAPPAMTTSLVFHGGLRGLGSTYRENSAGFGAAVRIAAATTADEAEALARQRTLTHIVVPSWDSFLDTYASLGTTQARSSLVGLLSAWMPPLWLEPVSYFMPPVPGYADERINVFEVTEVQDQPLALSRLAEYFLDMGDVELAARLCRAMSEGFPDDLTCQIAVARGQLLFERHKLGGTVETMMTHIAEGAAEDLPWDRRVSLALVLFAGKRTDEAREQAAWCVEFADESAVRRLAAPALFHFTKLCERLSLKLQDPSLERIVQERLPVTAAPAP